MTIKNIWELWCGKHEKQAINLIPYVKEQLGNLYQKCELFYKSENTKMKKLLNKIWQSHSSSSWNNTVQYLQNIILIRLTPKWKMTCKARLMKMKKKHFLISSELPQRKTMVRSKPCLGHRAQELQIFP